MEALVLAGGHPGPTDPLYPYTQGRPKALLDLAGRPMLQWVLDALNQAPRITGVRIFGVDPDAYPWEIAQPVHFYPDQGSMLHNILHGLATIGQQATPDTPVLLVSGDVPTITGEVVEWAAANADRHPDADVVYHVVERRVMEARFPGVQRTYLRLKDVEVCGGDVNLVRVRAGQREDDLWERIVAARKSPFQQARLLGWGVLLGVLLRRFTLEQAAVRASQRLRLAGVAVLSPYAELAMDVDKPAHLEIVRQDLQARAADASEATA